MSPEEITLRFAYHRPTAEGLGNHETINRRLEEMAHFLNDLLPESREASLSITHLEEARYWAHGAIARRT